MFQGRVMGVGSQMPGTSINDDLSFLRLESGKVDWTKVIPQVPIGRVQVCHPQSPAGTCKPVDWKPDAASDLAPDIMPVAKSSGFPLPLILGAAYLLLS